jgi:hypothetical protein
MHLNATNESKLFFQYTKLKKRKAEEKIFYIVDITFSFVIVNAFCISSLPKYETHPRPRFRGAQEHMKKVLLENSQFLARFNWTILTASYDIIQPPSVSQVCFIQRIPTNRAAISVVRQSHA